MINKKSVLSIAAAAVMCLSFASAQAATKTVAIKDLNLVQEKGSTEGTQVAEYHGHHGGGHYGHGGGHYGHGGGHYGGGHYGHGGGHYGGGHYGHGGGYGHHGHGGWGHHGHGGWGHHGYWGNRVTGANTSKSEKMPAPSVKVES
jgi:hypothetical protein